MAEPDDAERIEQLTGAVLAAPKARHVLPSFINSLVTDELRRRPAPDREIVKRVKRTLHQVGGAYLTPTPRYDRLLARLTDASPGGERDAAVADVLRAHASTRERSSDLAGYYAALFDGIDDAGTVLDLACGLNPLARPLMPRSISSYLACDIYLDLLGFVAAATDVLGAPVETFAHDLNAGPPVTQADVVLLLKTLPCLEQLDPDAGRRLLVGLATTADHVLVTYPVRSLGGSNRGMRATYADRFEALVDRVTADIGRRIAVTPLDLPGELGFRVSF